MIRSLILRTSAALASAALVFASVAIVATSAQAATISYSDPNCSSFSITGTAPNYILVCAKLTCQALANPASPTPSQSVQITATCNGVAPGSVTWSFVSGGDASCPQVPAAQANTNPLSLGAPGTVANSCVYQVNAVSGALTGQAQTTISWTNTPPAAPQNCHLGATPPSLPIGGGSVVLTATCDNGGVPTSYAWTGNNLPTPTVNSQVSTNITQTTTFTVTPSNSTGPGNTASVTVNVAGTVLGFCGQYGTVLPVVNATWGQQGSWPSAQIGNFGDNTIWVFKLFVPPGTPNSAILGRFTVSEYQGPNTPRQLTISTQACDFRKYDYTGVNGPLAVCDNGTTCEIQYGVATPTPSNPAAGLTAGQTYYVNVRNYSFLPPPGGYDCGMPTCNAIMNDTAATP